jgi:predicted ATP-grasp superfamily ATP-dependent carboligase
MTQQIGPEAMFMKIGVLSVEVDILRSQVEELKAQLEVANAQIKKLEQKPQANHQTSGSISD